MGWNGLQNGWAASTSTIINRLPVPPACRSDDAFVGAPPAVRPQGAAHRKCFQASECRKRQFGGCFSDHAPPQTHQAAFDRFVEFQRIPTRPTKTNAYQRDQRQTNRIPKEIPVTPHALKLLSACLPANQVGDPWLLWHHYRFQKRFLDCELLTLVSRCPRWRHAFTCCKRKWLAYLDSSCLN